MCSPFPSKRVGLLTGIAAIGISAGLAAQTAPQPSPVMVSADAEVPQAPQPQQALQSQTPATAAQNPSTTPATTPASGQQPGSNPGSNQGSSQGSNAGAGSSSSGQNANTQGKVPGTSNDRLFYTLPNFLTLKNGGKLPPLTAKQKFKVVALGTFDPVEYPWWGLLSAISQASDGEPAYGQGWAAYGKRYATTAADSTIENFMVGAVFPSVLHQDPRFYQSGEGGFGHRTGYAVSRILVTRTDSGHSQFNYSEIFGAAFAAAISSYSYHPRSTVVGPASDRQFIGSDRTLANAGSTWATQVGEDTVTYLIKEFWPDIKHKLSKNK